MALFPWFEGWHHRDALIFCEREPKAGGKVRKEFI
jgi:hypothetical protein